MIKRRSFLKALGLAPVAAAIPAIIPSIPASAATIEVAVAPVTSTITQGSVAKLLQAGVSEVFAKTLTRTAGESLYEGDLVYFGNDGKVHRAAT